MCFSLLVNRWAVTDLVSLYQICTQTATARPARLLQSVTLTGENPLRLFTIICARLRLLRRAGEACPAPLESMHHASPLARKTRQARSPSRTRFAPLENVAA